MRWDSLTSLLLHLAAVVLLVVSSPRLSLAGTADKTQQLDVKTIIPGKSVGNLSLGMKKTDLQNVFSWRDKPDETYSYDRPCEYTEIHWVDVASDSTGVFAYLADDRVFEITAVSKRFKVKGIKSSFGATLEEIRTTVPKGELFRWTNSGSKVNGGEDVYFWVVKNEGIAFGLYYNSRLRSRRVESITVFSPHAKFQPEGCLRPPQDLVLTKHLDAENKHAR